MTPAPQETGTSAVVTFANVRIGFDEGDVLRGVSFEVMPRETLVLLGETGTGKTLTLKMAAELTRIFKALGFLYVTLDLEGFRSGSMNAVLPLQDVRKARP